MKLFSSSHWLLAILHVFQQQEGSVLAAVFIIVVSLWGFVELADEVQEGSTRTLDLWVMGQLRRADNPQLPIGPSWLVDAGQQITALGGVAVLTLVVLAVIGYLLRQRAYSTVSLVFVATAGGIVLSVVLKHFFDRDRPDVLLHLVTVRSSSFPSGHAMLSATIYLTLGAVLTQVVAHRRDKIYVITVALVLTLLIGVSRVYLGVHYPTDVLAGWSVGLAWALLCWVAARSLRYRGAVESGGEQVRNEQGHPPGNAQ